MTVKEITIGIQDGLQARKTAFFVQLACSFKSDIYVTSGKKKANAKSIVGVTSLALSEGEEITVTAEGSDEEAAVKALEEFFTEGTE